MKFLKDLDLNGASRLRGLLDPILDGDAVSKSYVAGLDTAGLALAIKDFWQYDVLAGSGNYGAFSTSVANSGTISTSSATSAGVSPQGITIQSAALANSGGRVATSVTPKDYISSEPRKFIARVAFPLLDADIFCRIGWLNQPNTGVVTDGFYLTYIGGVLAVNHTVGGSNTVLGTFLNPVTANKVYTIIIDLNESAAGDYRVVLYDEAFSVLGSVVGNLSLTSAVLLAGLTAFSSSGSAKDLIIVHGIGYGTISGYKAWVQASREVKQIEIDFGSTPKSRLRYDLAFSGVTASSRINAWQSGQAPTGRAADENEMDQFHVVAIPSNGSIRFIVTCLSGTAVGKYKINYQLG